MSGCEEKGRVQGFLDAALPDEALRAFRAHLDHCPDCGREVAAYRRLFRSLDRLPLFDPAPTLADRILEWVLPSRRRRRWIRTAGWAYSGALAASLVAAFLWWSRPAPRALLESLWSEVSGRMVQTVLFAFNATSFLIVRVAEGWRLMSTLGERLEPLVRGLAAPLASPAIQWPLALALVSCVAVLWWMRPRGKAPSEEMHHVALVGL